MKYILTSLLFLSFSLATFAQTPEKMSYQAIIRSSDNALVVDSAVSLKILIRENAPNGTIVFEENHSVTTNSNGLVAIEIGTGNSIQGTFSNIRWGQNTHFVETRVDPNGGSNYNITGVSQLLSVPYALHAKTAETITGSVVSAPYRAEVIPFTASRNISSTDVNNTIACTTSSAYTITSNFSTMEIGDTINLEAHNGATLTVNAGNGVTLNYIPSGTAQFISNTGNVRFGMIRKSGQNAYIISGQ